MKVSKFKLAFTVLLVATIIWGIAFYYTLQEYHKYCEWLDEQPWSKWDLKHPFWTWNGGKYVCVTGGLLFVAWMLLILSYLLRRISQVA